MIINKKNMFDNQLKPEGISCSRTINSMSKVNREDFTPPKYINLSYADYSIPLNRDYSMLKPLHVAKILQYLEINKKDEVLEIGTGSGYLTCCMSFMAKFIDTVDIDLIMLEKARAAHKKYNIYNIDYIHKDIFSNWIWGKKYDIIILNGSIESRIKKLEDMLNINGRIFFVMGKYPLMNANIIKRVSENKLINYQLFETTINPLKNFNKKKFLNF